MGRTANRRRGLWATAVLGGIVAVAAGCGADAGDDTSPDHRSFALHGRTLTVDSDDSTLVLVPGDGDKVRVTRWFKGKVVLGGDPKVSWKVDGDRLVLRTHCSGFVADCSAKHRIEVPRGVAVKVREDDGGVTARGFRSAVDIRTADGTVRVSDVTGPLSLHSEDGSVHASGVGSRRVRVGTKDGSVHLDMRAVPDRVEAESDDGSLTLTLPHAAYRVTATSKDGSVHVSVPRDKGSAHVIGARTQDGSVTVRPAGD
ncbi:DUF4097 family beta strand repeat-containing protein [Streptomyces sp. ECR3]|uniref:DUF4097 family beta strand repeat-containing protein n=1 Tax=Streptomyces sp. ECR3 TaxID=3400630 RepID=UPI003F1A7EFE